MKEIVSSYSEIPFTVVTEKKVNALKCVLLVKTCWKL